MPMSSELREAIEAAIQTHDDGNGAPIGQVVQTVAAEFGIGPTLGRVLDLYRRGDLYTTGDTRVRVTHRDSTLLADGGTRFALDYPCDWVGEADEQCGETPTAYVGDLYYACEDHHDEYRAVVTDGGIGDLRPFGGEVPDGGEPFTIDVEESVLAPNRYDAAPPDPETCHPDEILGRHAEVDYGSGTRAGTIYKVVDYVDERGRWIHLKPESGPTAQVDPAVHEITLQGRGDPSE